MKNFLKKILEDWKARKRARAEKALDDLRISYHTFRVLLANNDRSLDLLLNIDRLLTSPAPSRTELSEKIEDLLSITYELVDGLNRLTGNRYARLYEKHDALSTAIRQSLRSISIGSSRAAGCIFLEDLTPDDQSMAGGKAASLAILKQAGLPVPDGFVLSANACKEILMAKHLDSFIRERLSGLEADASRKTYTEGDAEDIRKRILQTELPESLSLDIQKALDRLKEGGEICLSVRSSALVEDHPEHTFAGQFKTVLNVNSFESATTALKEVVASNFSVRSTMYRLNAGLPLAEYDMAVLFQRMVPARAAGVLFTVDPTSPESNRMLISAVSGLGSLAVGGDAPADIYRPLRDEPEREAMDSWATIAQKTRRIIALPQGGIAEEDVPAAQKDAPLLSEAEIFALLEYGHAIESLSGLPQDIEWAISSEGKISILQARPARLAHHDRRSVNLSRGKVLLESGVCASPGRCVGKVKVIRNLKDLDALAEDLSGPVVMVLKQSMVDAARWLPDVAGVVVDFGNPADHLSCVAREYSRPMLTGTGKATEALEEGRWIILEADKTRVLEAPERAWAEVVVRQSTRHRKKSRPAAITRSPDPVSARLRQWIEPLNLTDAYGPTFSIVECKSLHDIIRYSHEMAVMAMFSAGDEVLEDASSVLLRLGEDVPFHFHIIDLGGGVVPGCNRKKMTPNDILSTPLLALWKGITTSGLRWNEPAPVAAVSNLFGRSLLDGAGARPVGSQNYAMITRDYLNLNTRLDYHFAMIDAVCGLNSRANYIRFRFKGGGTSAVQRQRRARFIAEVLQSLDFFTDQREDLVTASIVEVCLEVIQDRLTTLGQLLGFSRLMDAAMLNESLPHKVAQAFLAGDYRLESLKDELALSS
ncbi:PEP/pyruvate-binding domain-containing protein [Desulforhabdus amnigena]|uniref:Phosphoenolpyruvate synthase n=1 Tax=Desulforhabdus amnigena TaxID=40218 RepID=A0A9W6D5B0_9BACT|nr:PEP/pyruvate-binding domain-containing protein [Desulforhabdus amnigena]GLI34420.1 pyruvate phosphate dikinase PEP/pyruvate binding subunit [Desulforhabdus amnigena]